MRYKPRSIEDDPAAYLEDMRPIHNGLGLPEILEKLRLGVKYKRIAEDCGVDISTFQRWRRAFKKKGIWSESDRTD